MHSFVVLGYCQISRSACVPGLQRHPLSLGRGVGFQNMPAGSFCLKLPVKDNYCSTITFCTGTFNPFDMNKHTTGTCIFISFDPSTWVSIQQVHVFLFLLTPLTYTVLDLDWKKYLQWNIYPCMKEDSLQNLADLVTRGDHELQLLPLYQTLMVLSQFCTSLTFPFQPLISSWFVLF